MGCGTSNDNIVTTPARVVSPATMSNTKMLNHNTSQPTTGILSNLILIFDLYPIFCFNLVSNGNTTKILIASHTAQQTISERLRQGLLDQGLSCYILNESTPHSLSARANAIQWCDVFVIVISRLYQRTAFCMEALNYAKDIHKSIIVVLAEPSFRPYGALGAISASAIRSITLSDDNSFVHAISQITNSVRTQVPKKANTANVKDPSEVKNDFECSFK